MACLLVPATQALIVSVAKNRVESHSTARIPLKRKLTWLTTMLWGGALLLGLEHLWHGEIMLAFPFLTGATSAAAAQAMLVELATVGVGMAVLVTAVWGLMVLAVERVPKLALAVSPSKG